MSGGRSPIDDSFNSLHLIPYVLSCEHLLFLEIIVLEI